MTIKYLAILVLLALLISLTLGGTFQVPTANAQDGEGGPKISSLLGLQVAAKRRNLEAVPLAEGRVDILRAMQARGAMVTPLNRQKIFIHTSEELNQAQVKELEAMGLTLYLDSWIPPVRYHPNGFILADMPIDKLNELSNKGYIIRLDTAERLLEQQNDLGAQKINADDVWALSYNGSGVTIAVLDSGLDVTHNDIPTPIASWDYAEDDATIANTVSGHGTHVAGSALGRGTQSSGTYNGTAPGADLVFLKIGTDNTSDAPISAMVNAIKAAVDNYTADIITMSYGGWDEYHDGTSQEAQAVDYAVSQGAVVFISAGNDANYDLHYSGTVNASSNSSYIQVNVTNAGLNDTALCYYLVWYDGVSTRNDLEIKYYDSSYTLLSSNSSAAIESSRGTESDFSYYNYYVPVGSSTWYLQVQNHSTNSQFFHLYYSTYYNQSEDGLAKFNSPDANYTIASPADADSAIAVGAYTTRKYWWDFYNDKYSYTPGETEDTITTFSSRGPRVDSGAPPKPNIVAPGSAIISCRDDDVYSWEPKPARGNPGNNYESAPYIDNDGPNADNATRNDGNGPADYYIMQGTSMACPIAAGVAALILEKNHALTPAQIKQAIENTAVDKGDTGFDTTYGWGLIDALAAVDSVTSTTDISNSPSSYPFGILSENSSYQTGLTYFTVTNNSAYPVNVTISGSDMSGGVTWTLSDTATPGADTYGLRAGLEGGNYTIIVKRNGPYNSLVSNLASSANQSWGLELLSPTSFSDSVQKSGTVTLTATQP